jgi:2-polyprenyl-6-methoxyphenol hydroxylase-like FAD-dependent oxidoreductase
VNKPITIIGGGLAGLTLGIGLRQRGVPVVVWEAGRYPRHRVCGEFISGNGQAVLERLNLRNLFENAGAFKSGTARFFSGSVSSPIRNLPAPALCLSRHTMDTLLAEELQRLGGELRANTRCALDKSEGIVHASGRRANPTANGWRWFGLKVHARKLNLSADLEMYLSQDGYIGVNRIDNGLVNVCGLFRARPGDAAVGSRFDSLRGRPGTALHERLAQAELDEASFSSIAGLSLTPQHPTPTECRVGDALTMIPPVTGNGMSMAFESAELAVEPLSDYSSGKLNWSEAQRKIAAACESRFAKRLAWARFVQWLMFSPLLQTPLSSLLFRSDRLWQVLFARTR